MNHILEGIQWINQSVLDLGCGQCLMSKTKHFNHLKSYTGVDDQLYTTPVEYILSDVVDYLKKDSNHFDIILCLGVLDHLDEIKATELLSELSYRRNSTLVLSCRNSGNPFIRLLHPTGFNFDVFHEHGVYHKLFLLKFPMSKTCFRIRFLPRLIGTEMVFYFKPVFTAV
ncbi:MAG: class I SAM-dependent methyltransferase [Saprospiraceae bacterium]|nr:class I SAM-dependent methyltransferase [Saprospiraceae bacterium]